MGRPPRASSAFFAALGLSGCLLFTDPINEAPVVTIHPPSDPLVVVRGTATYFTATVTDDKDTTASFLVEWAEFTPQLGGCLWITPATWVAPKRTETLDSSAPYMLVANTPDALCLCARATDHNGATGFKCLQPITPKNSVPVARIIDVSGDPSGQPRPLCSPMHLSAEKSDFLAGDTFDWTIAYTGTEPAPKVPQLAECPGVAVNKAKQHRCFSVGSPGSYTVTLTITDSVVLNGNTINTPSEPAMFEIPVKDDTPPCLRRTDPEVNAQRILLSRSADLGGTYQSRTFRVLSVADDCEPYPLPAGATGSPSQFVWSVLDTTRASPTWTYQTNISDSFTVSQSLFPSARPGDTIQLRVEVRDSVVQNQLLLLGGAAQICSTVSPETSPTFCCGSVACGTPNDCVRWTTWTVQFQP